MRSNLFRSYLLLIAITAVSGITVTAQNAALAGEKWVLTELNGRSVGNTAAFIDFERNTGRFSGNAGCNTMSGNVTIRRNTIRFSSISTTRKFCGRGYAMRIERELQQVLNAARRFDHSRRELTIRGTRMSAVFRAEGRSQNTPPVTALDSRKWMLQSIAGRPVGGLGSDAFVNFDSSKMSAGGNSSCNVFGGTYFTTGNRISITEIISTMRACDEDERMNIEREFLDGLREANRYEVQAYRLILFRGQRELLSFNGVSK